MEYRCGSERNEARDEGVVMIGEVRREGVVIQGESEGANEGFLMRCKGTSVVVVLRGESGGEGMVVSGVS